MKVLFTKGNKKLPKSTYILNVGSATNCPSKRLGLCEVCKECYAMKAEIQYPATLPFRERQREVFNTMGAAEIALALLDASVRSHTNKMKHFRFSEAGDFETQADVDKMAEICRILGEHGVTCYGYTARTDLDLNELIYHASLNVSNDLNGWTSHGANRFKAVKETTSKYVCAGDCRKCSLCFNLGGQEIQVALH